MKEPGFLSSARRVCAIFLVISLLLGVAASAFGVSVLATGKGNDAPADKTPGSPDTNGTPEESGYRAPTEDYPELENQMVLNDNVVVLSEEASEKINDAIIDVRSEEYDDHQLSIITLEGADHKELEELSRDDIFYLQGDDDSPLGGDRIWKVYSVSQGSDETCLKVTEPYMEEVFDCLGINASDALNEENFVGAYYAEGVSAHFGNIETDMDMMNAQRADASALQVHTLSTAPRQQQTTTLAASDSQTKAGDLIVDINYDYSKNKEEDKKSNKKEDDNIDASYGIKGQFGIRDLTSHVVCDIPEFGQFNEMYIGLSGETFLDVDIYGEISATAEMKAGKKDMKLQ